MDPRQLQLNNHKAQHNQGQRQRGRSRNRNLQLPVPGRDEPPVEPSPFRSGPLLNPDWPSPTTVTSRNRAVPNWNQLNWDLVPEPHQNATPQSFANMYSAFLFPGRQRVFKIRVIARDVTTIDDSAGPSRESHHKQYSLLLLLGAGQSISCEIAAPPGGSGLGQLDLRGINVTRPAYMVAHTDVKALNCGAHFDETTTESDLDGRPPASAFMDAIREASNAFGFAFVNGRYHGSALWVETMLDRFRRDGLIRNTDEEKRAVGRMVTQ